MNLDLYRSVTVTYKGSHVNKAVLQNLAYLSDRDGAFTVDVQVLSRNVGVTEERIRQAVTQLVDMGHMTLSSPVLHYVQGKLQQ